MNDGIQVQPVSSAEWCEIAPSFSDYSVYQTAAFGEVSAADTGSRLDRVFIRHGGRVIGAAQVRIKALPLFSTGLAYIYFGPMCRPQGLEDYFEQVVDALRKEYVIRRGHYLRISPNRWIAECSANEPILSSGWKAAGNQPYQSILVDLTPDVSALRAGLVQKWRNGLNQAEKRSVRIESSSDDAAMTAFEHLYDQMWQRKQFETGVTVSSFCRLQQLLAPAEKMAIHLAYLDEAVVAGHVSSMLGDSCIYLLGASNETGRSCKAAYALQWHALVAARNAGMRWYDLGGVDPNTNPGVYHFKSGLGGVLVRLFGPLDAPPRGLGRFLIPIAERAYRAFRKPGRSQPVASQHLTESARTTCPGMPKLSS